MLDMSSPNVPYSEVHPFCSVQSALQLLLYTSLSVWMCVCYPLGLVGRVALLSPLITSIEYVDAVRARLAHHKLDRLTFSLSLITYPLTHTHTHKMGLLPTLTGTYDVLTIPLLLPTKTVESLLPPQYQNCTPSLLLATPDHFLTSIPCSSGALPTADAKKQYHLVLLQLGHQQHTGPGPFKMTFQEAKLEIPFVRHPKASEASDKGRREFLFKQKW